MNRDNSGRFQDEGLELADFETEILIRCPRCSNRALAGKEDGSVRLTCTHCGHHQSKEAKTTSAVYGLPVDPWFQLPLFLQTDFEGHGLFAYNGDHLTYLKQIISARLRIRKKLQNGYQNRSMMSRLPVWMTEAHNRNAILKKIAELERLLPENG